MPVILLAADPLTVAVIRVEFQADDSPATTGDGTFVIADTLDIECSEWTLDPPPHDKSYFQDHLIAADNYWRKVSNDQAGIDLASSAVFPAAEAQAYQLDHEMIYYHPYLEDYDETQKLVELTHDAIAAADADINFNDFNTVIVVHAGMGGDFAFALDPTPGNIPSAYLTQADFQVHGTVQADGKTLENIIVIPESQNFLQYAETRSLFEDTPDPCFYQVGLNGTLALMLGFHLDLAPLYNTETGRSLVGGFALMDQGSNNFHGVVPAYPNPYTRIQNGWVNAVSRGVGDTVFVNVNDTPVKIQISEDEYYLIENRQRNLITPDTMTLWVDSLAYDTVSVVLSDRGVVLDVDEQHAGLPGNGLNIWHIDESAIFTPENPNGGPVQFIDFIEGDGAQDMGHITQLIFADYLETGWWFDTWFAGNAGWFDINKTQAVVGDSLLSFNSTTHPATNSTSGQPTHLSIENISNNGATMSFTIASDRLVNTSAVSSFIGWDATRTSLWAFNTDSTEFLECKLVSGQLICETNSLFDPDSIFDGSVDSTFTYRDGLIAPKMTAGVRLFEIASGQAYHNPGLDSLFELVRYEDGIKYFARQNDGYVNVYEKSGLSTITPVSPYPLASFPPVGPNIFYGNHQLDPIPAALRNQNASSDDTAVISWSSSDASLSIKRLGDDGESSILVDKPLHIIPIDADDNGDFEIALFYDETIKIINQAGVSWNGNPFAVESYYGNPIVAPLNDGRLGIFLRHADNYSVHSLSGELMDVGVLPAVSPKPTNALWTDSESVYVLSGNELLYFSYETMESATFWTDPQGNAKGDRTVILTGTPAANLAKIKKGSVYNYPNPIKGSSTTIRAWLGDVDTWTIEIFSLNGAQIEYTELDVEQGNSYNEWLWDASGVSNGVYLAQIRAGDRSEIIKIAVIR